MPYEIVILGVQMPTLLPLFVAVGIVHLWIDYLLSHLGWYRFVWHLGLFRTALFCVLFSSTSLYVYHTS